MTIKEKEAIKNKYNMLVKKYYDLRSQADMVKDAIQQIEGLVEYEA